MPAESRSTGRTAHVAIVALLCRAGVIAGLIATVLLATVLLAVGGAHRAGAATISPSADTSAGPSGAATARAATQPKPVSVSITDNQTSVRAGQTLSYQTTVTNLGALDLQLLLEISVPAAAAVTDAGGGTMRQAVIDYGITVLAHGHVTEKFTIAVAKQAGDQRSLATVASAYVLGTATADGSGPDVAATDSDTITGARAAGGAAASGAAIASAAARPDAAGPAKVSAGPAHEGLWIAALVLGGLLVVAGITLLGWPGGGARSAPTPGRRRRRGARPAPAHHYLPTAGRPAAPAARHTPQSRTYIPQPGSLPPQPGGYIAQPGSLPHPGRAARRAARAAADAGIRTGAHSASRSAR